MASRNEINRPRGDDVDDSTEQDNVERDNRADPDDFDLENEMRQVILRQQAKTDALEIGQKAIRDYKKNVSKNFDNETTDQIYIRMCEWCRNQEGDPNISYRTLQTHMDALLTGLKGTMKRGASTGMEQEYKEQRNRYGKLADREEMPRI